MTTAPEFIDASSRKDDFARYLGQISQRVESALDRLVRRANSPFCPNDSQSLTGRLFEAMRYAVLDGGKRLRPTLFYATYEALGGSKIDASDLDRIAAALECEHGYSLIHDDLPAMDDDALRRGKPSCHCAFDEATAILAGDALQSLGFQLISECDGIAPATRLALLTALAKAIGPLGMVAGQAIDIEAAGKRIDETHLETMHRLKTGALIQTSVRLGAICADTAPDVAHKLDRFAQNVGLAFQLRDDLLDAEGTTETLGKTAGADAIRNKPTYVMILGPDGTRRRLAMLLADSHALLGELKLASSRLAEIAEYIGRRSH